MKKELDERLCADYPEIFRDRHGDVRTTAMCWGFSCGDGWYTLIDQLCCMLTSKYNQLRRDVKHVEEMIADPDKSQWDEWQHNVYNEEKLATKKAELEQALQQIPVAVQVKEKFGGLRFYVNGATDEQYNYIRFAEAMSYRICEECGSTQDVMVYPLGWQRSLCPEHAKQEYGDEAEHYRNKTGEWAEDAP